MKHTVQQGARNRSGRKGGVLAAAALCVAMVAAFFTAPVPARAASAYDPVSATVPVEVALSGDKPSAALTSTFVMEPAEGETVSPEQDELTIKGGGKASFELSFDEVGVHRYTVTQTTKDADRWTIDRQVYDVTVYCFWDEETDTLYTEFTAMNGEGKKDVACVFTNGYKAPAAPKDDTEGDLPETGDTALLPVAVVCALGVVAVGAGVAMKRRRASTGSDGIDSSRDER